MATQCALAVDLGASSGRVMAVRFDGRAFTLEQRHRFVNTPVATRQHLYWDVLRLWHEVREALADAPPDAVSVGVDTWGVDYALLDRAGGLLSNPVSYRDARTDGAMDWVFARVPRHEVFARTGIQFLKLNTLYQLASMRRDDSPLLDVADALLMLPDLFHYWLTGEKTCEFTIATTTQCYSPHTQGWDGELLGALGLPQRLFQTVVAPGTRLGNWGQLAVIAPCSHDTGSAVVAVPATTPDAAYLSSGTWSLLGLELPGPVVNEAAYAANVTSEGGYGGTYRFLKNIMGLWLLEQSLAAWRAEGLSLDYDALNAEAAVVGPGGALFDPDDERFFPPGPMPARIRDYCQATGQPAPQTPGATVAAIYASLALKYRHALDLLEEVSGRRALVLHIIGGGSQNALLCQWTADALGRLVVAGPSEATALGNAMVQFIAQGALGSLSEARACLAQSVGTTTYLPQQPGLWDDTLGRFRQLLAAQEGHA